jgi:hypothetical protein
MENKFTIEKGKSFENLMLKVGVSLFMVLLCWFCAHYYLFSSISMLVHDLPFQAFGLLAKIFYFQLLLCLLIRVIKSFAKSLCFLGVLFIGHDCWKLHQNLLHSRSLEFARCSLLSLLKSNIVKSVFERFWFLAILYVSHSCQNFH